VHGHSRFALIDLHHYRDAVTRPRTVTELAQALGPILTTSVLGVKTGPPSDKQRTQLHHECGERVAGLIRSRHVETGPLIYSAHVFPEILAKGLFDSTAWAGSMVRLLKSWGITLAHAGASIHAMLPSPTVACQPGAVQSPPWIPLTQVNYDTERRPRLFSHDYQRGDKVSFRVTRHRVALSPVALS